VLWTFGGFGTALLIFSLCFSIRAYRLGLGRSGLNMTILSAGACMIVAASAQTEWKSPRVLSPLLRLGQRSYEVYLTHMFVVFAFFQLFITAGKPMGACAGAVHRRYRDLVRIR
jgi:peptidoglycan/LPS O-acetylase OafA/YrhL